MKILIFLFVLFPVLSLGATQISVETGFLQQNYNEPGMDTEQGMMPVVKLGASHTFKQLFVSGSFSYSRGPVDYEGTDLYTGKHLSMEDVSRISEGTLRVGIHTKFVSPFLEGSIYKWNRELSQVQDEKYSSVFIGTGVILKYARQNFVVSLTPSGEINFDSKMKTEGLNFSLGPQPYEEIQTKIEYKLTNHWNLSTVASYKHFGFGPSRPQHNIYEPKSITKQIRYGIQIGFDF